MVATTQGLRSLMPGPGNTAGVDGGAISGISEIIDGTVQGASLAAGTITATQIAAGTITAAQIAAGTITGTQIATGTVTTGNVSPALIQSVSIALSSAQILGMYVTPVQVTTPAVAGKSILPLYWLLRMVRSATAYASGGNVQIQYGNTGSGGGTAQGNTLSSSVITGGAGTVDTFVPALAATNITTTQNSNIFVTNATGAFTTGTGTATLVLWYALV